METHSTVDAKFERMRDSGRSAMEVSAAAIADGFDFAQNLQMLRRVFNLDFAHAKEAWLQAKGIASSLDEYQDNLIPLVEEALSQLDDHGIIGWFNLNVTADAQRIRWTGAHQDSVLLKLVREIVA